MSIYERILTSEERNFLAVLSHYFQGHFSLHSKARVKFFALQLKKRRERINPLPNLPDLRLLSPDEPEDWATCGCCDGDAGLKGYRGPLKVFVCYECGYEFSL